MSVLFLLVILFSCTSSVLSIKDFDNENALLKMKKQLGDPDLLSSWVKGFHFCEFTTYTPIANMHIGCTSDGRVNNLVMLQLINITAPFPKAICDLTELDILVIIRMPGLYGPIPSCITKLTNLRQLIIRDTSLSGCVPHFYNHTNLMYLALAQSHLSGTIPSSLSTLPNLSSLDLSSNYLTGSIPPGLLPRPSSTLILSNNNLTGEIPKCYGSVDFWLFDVANNQLNGDASFLFSKQKMVVNYIVLANNDFQFDLSYVEFSDNIYGFDLSHNKIYGKVPYSLANAARLLYPNLSFNKLCGELPKGGNMWRFNLEVFQNNSCLCGSPLPPCFDSASAPAPAPGYTSAPSFAFVP